MKPQLQKLTARIHCTVAISCNICNEAAAAESQSNDCIATGAISCNSCNEAGAAETAMVALELQERPATVGMKLQQQNLLRVHCNCSNEL